MRVVLGARVLSARPRSTPWSLRVTVVTCSLAHVRALFIHSICLLERGGKKGK